MNRAVFLDRDNTIIHNDGDLGDPDQVRLIQGAATAIASLCGLGYKIIVVTNQGGVARGKYTEDDVLLVHERIDELVREGANGARIERFYYCPYHPRGTVEAYCCEHPSRKPNPGMLLQAAEDLKIDLSQSWTIGDQVRDVQAGAAAGTRTILLRNDADLLKPIELDNVAGVHHEKNADSDGTPPVPEPPDYIVRTLPEAVRVIAHARRPEAAEHLHHAHVAGKRFDAAAVAKLQRRREPAPDVERPPKQAAKPDDPADEGKAAPSTGSDAPEVVEASPASPAAPPQDAPTDDAGTRVRERFRQLREQKERQNASSPQPDEGAAQPATQPTPGTTDASTETVEKSSPEATAREVTPPWASIDQTLRLMLQELRGQRGSGGDDFSYLYVVAIVLQMVAGLCLVGGLWMGAGDDGLFVRWIGAGIMVQLATIAALMFSK